MIRGWVRIIVNHLIRHLHRWHTVHPTGMGQLHPSDNDNDDDGQTRSRGSHRLSYGLHLMRHREGWRIARCPAHRRLEVRFRRRHRRYRLKSECHVECTMISFSVDELRVHQQNDHGLLVHQHAP